MVPASGAFMPERPIRKQRIASAGRLFSRPLRTIRQGVIVKHIFQLALAVLLLTLALPLLAACTPMEEKRDAHMTKARSMEQEGRCAEAVQEAQEAMALDPSYAGGHLLIARCAIKDNKPETAAENFNRALELDPDSLDALLGLGRIALLSNHIREAADYAHKAEALGDDSLELTVIRAGILMKQDKYAEAKPLLEKALALAPRNEETIVGLAAAQFHTGEIAKAKELLTSSLKELPGSTAITSLLLTLAVREKDYPTAESYLRQLMAADPEDQNLVLQLSELHILAGKPDEARQLLTDFLGKHPAALSVRMRLAEMEVARRQYDAALALLDAAPEQSGALALDKAGVLLRAGRIDQGIALLQTLAADPKADKAAAERARMGLVEVYMQQGKPEEAEKELNAVLAANPDNMIALFTRGRLHLGQKRAAAAVADLERVVKAQPDNLQAAIAMAEAAYSNGDPALAEALITRVNQRAPKFGQGYVAMANLYVAQKKNEAALLTLRMGQREVPNDPNLFFAEADILASLKRYTEAQKVLEELAKKKQFAEAALIRLADVHAAAGEAAKAASVYERLLALNPQLPGLKEARIQALLAAKQTKAALAEAEKLQTEKPDDRTIAFMVGEAALAGKDKKKAEQAYRRALELAPDWEPPLTALMQLYLGDKRVDDGLKLCKELRQKAPDAAGPAFFQGMLLERKGDRAGAEKIYREVLAKHPKMLPAAHNLAFLLSSGKAKQETLLEAEALARTAASGGAPSALDTLGWIQYRLGKHIEAETNLRKAYAAYKDNPVVAYHLAATLAVIGKSAPKSAEGKSRLAESRKILEKMLTQKGNFPYKEEAKKLLAEVKAVK